MITSKNINNPYEFIKRIDFIAYFDNKCSKDIIELTQKKLTQC